MNDTNLNVPRALHKSRLLSEPEPYDAQAHIAQFDSDLALAERSIKMWAQIICSSHGRMVSIEALREAADSLPRAQPK